MLPREDLYHRPRELTPAQKERALFQQAKDARAKAAKLRAQAVELDAEAERFQSLAEDMA